MMTDSAGLPIAALGYDRAHWRPRRPDVLSAAQVRRQTGDYDSAVPATIVSWRPTLSGELAADLADAEATIRRFDAHGIAVLGAAAAELGPMSAILLRTESASSSQIERLTASARAIAAAEIGMGDRRNATTIVGNVRAMETALAVGDAAGEITVPAILAMHARLLEHDDEAAAYAGVLRSEPVWVGGDDGGPRGADYVAPRHDRVPGALVDLVRFADRRDLPPLLQIAVAHAQFETIHPFVDGNGRTGRALAHAMLRSTGLSVSATLPLSAGFLRDTARYFAALTAFRAGDADAIVRVFADAARYAAATGMDLVDQLHARIVTDRGALVGVRSDAAAHALLPRLIGQPVINAEYVVRELGISLPGALRALELLVARGVVHETTGWKRNRVWVHRGVLEILDDYAAALRRSPQARPL